MIRRGERYRATRPLHIIAMTSWFAPCTGGNDAILPAGEEFVVSSDPVEGATAVSCDPVQYDQLHSHFVPARDRRNRRYRGYYLCVTIAEILAACTRVGCPSEPRERPRPARPRRPWDGYREDVEAGGAIGVLVPVLGGDPDTYHLVPAEDLGSMRFRLLGSLRTVEGLAYQPGDVVRCVVKVFALDGPAELLVVERVDL